MMAGKNMLRQRFDKFLGKMAKRYLPSWTQNYGVGRRGLHIPGNYHQIGSQGYEKSLIVAQAVNRIKSTMGMAMPLVKTMTEGKLIEADADNELLRLMRYPSLKTSRFDLFEDTAARLETEGNAFWFISGPGKQPTHIEVIPSRFIGINANQDNGKIINYSYAPWGTTGSNAEYIAPQQIIHFKRWHPNNQYWGLSTISAGMAEMEGDYAMALANQQFFGPRNAIPTLGVEVMGHSNQEQFDQMIADWRNSDREVFFFRSGVGHNPVKIHKIGLTPLEVSFLEGRKFNRKAIYELFGLSESMFDKDATEASSLTGERNYYQMVWERLVKIADQLTLELATYYSTYIGEWVVEFEDIRPVNEELKLKQITTAEKHLAINEVRDRYYDLDEVDWGDGPAAGSGSAYIQFFQNGMPAQGQLPPGNNTTPTGNAFEDHRQENNDPPPAHKEPPSKTPVGRQARGVLKMDKKALVKAQRSLLQAWDTNNPLVPEFKGLPDEVMDYIEQSLEIVTIRDDINTLFDPLFELLQDNAQIEGKAFEAWVVKQLAKLNPSHRDLVSTGAREIAKTFNWDERIQAIKDIPDEDWVIQPTAEL